MTANGVVFVPADMVDGGLLELIPERDSMTYDDDCYDFCCSPPDDATINFYACPECGMPWFRVQITQLLPETVRQGGGEFRVALDLPTTAWSTRRPC